jgi:multiple sugar transport system substrate-binding protein
MKNSTRSSIMLTLLLVFMLALTGVVSAQDQVTLEWWDYMGGGNDDVALTDLIARYMEAHPNVTIERTVIPFGDLKTRVIQAAATGTMPDIVIIDNPDHQSMAVQGAFADITDLVASWPDAEQYFPGPWASTVYQDRNYGVPYKSNATALFYNIDLLTAAGIDAPPETWDDLQAAALALTEGDRYGFCFSGVATEEGTFTILPFLWGNGSDIQTIGDDASIEALAFLNTLVNEDKSVPTSVLNLTQGDVNNLFMAGQCAMMINGPWQIPGIMENADVTFEQHIGMALQCPADLHFGRRELCHRCRQQYRSGLGCDYLGRAIRESGSRSDTARTVSESPGCC